MKKIIALLSILVVSISSSGFMPSEFNSDISKSQNYKLMIGEFSLQELKTTVNKKWFNSNYESYSPKSKVVEKIKSELETDDFSITVYMGTWCPDSRREFPHLIKILDQADFNLDHFKIIGVDRDKVVPNVSADRRQELNITNVPTIIVYDSKGNEINRIVEFPQETLEEDLLKIVSGQDYKHVYEF